MKFVGLCRPGSGGGCLGGILGGFCEGWQISFLVGSEKGIVLGILVLEPLASGGGGLGGGFGFGAMTFPPLPSGGGFGSSRNIESDDGISKGARRGC